ncbi:MAG: protein kinase [Deltaproteobacteria bacterium]|nr:protein kinase [Deltaproteobacteria bacterium]
MADALRYGAYELIEPIGRGGMGEVWRARHGALGRPVAVKLIRPDRLSGVEPEHKRELLKRFEREVRATSMLRSPHTVAVYDIGTAEDGTLFYAMELLEGINLQQLVAVHGPVPVERAVHLLLQACDALAEAHGLGLVHRDVKPGNLLACRLGLQHDYLKVLDFGLVKLEAAPSAQSQLTGDGTLIGSPAFMPPEVPAGTALDGRADLYALGCVAFWLVTGQLVFEGANPLQVLMRHAGEEPIAPSQRLGLSLPAAFDDLVLACLRKHPDERPAGAREVAAALRAIPLEQPWTAERAEAWWSEHPIAAPTAGSTSAPALFAAPAADETASAEPAPRPVARRVLNEKRERTIAELREQFVQSHIDATELGHRIRLAESAAAPADLDGLLRDLPELPSTGALVPAAGAAPGMAIATAPEGSALEPVPVRAGARNIISIFSGHNLAGAWRPPKRMRTLCVFGGTELDLRLARLQPGCTVIRAVAVFGGCDVIVPPGLYVEVDGIGIFGGFEESGGALAEPPTGDAPWVRITGIAVFGGVSVKVKEPPKEGGLLRAIFDEVRRVLPAGVREPAERALPSSSAAGREDAGK